MSDEPEEMVSCPGCGMELPERDSQAQIEHMQAEHPEIIEARLSRVGIVPPERSSSTRPRRS